MAEKDIIQYLINLAGQNQSDRIAAELDVHFADVDERDPLELMMLAGKLAKFVNYYQDTPIEAAGTWEAFFNYDRDEAKKLLTTDDGTVQPHLALFQAFLEMYRPSQARINQITGRHLDFYYKDVLRFEPRPAQADKAHVVLELKKNATPILIDPKIRFSAGKDGTGVEMIYLPTSDTIINNASVASLRSLYVDETDHGTVRYAPIANSSDGLGGEIAEEDNGWSGFGNEQLPAAEVGFALSSPVLRLKEGIRTIRADLQLNDADPAKMTDDMLEGSFEAFLTGEKTWLGPFTISPAIDANQLMSLELTLDENDEAVVDYNEKVHGYAFAAQAPILQVRLKADAPKVGYRSFNGIILKSARIAVEASKIKNLVLENDSGTLDPKKAFTPFGAQPTAGSRFMIGSEEALGKKLDELTLSIQWKDAPFNLASHYSNYGKSISNTSFTASVNFNDGGNRPFSPASVALFESGNASSLHEMKFSASGTSVSAATSTGMKYRALYRSGGKWAESQARSIIRWRPIYAAYLGTPVAPTAGYVTLTLQRDFLHADYRRKTVENALTYSRDGGTLTVLNEPYTPTIQSISLAYKAQSDEVQIDAVSLDEYTGTDLMFYHLTYFGQMREHCYQRHQFDFLNDKRVTLLPSYQAEGELLVGLSALDSQDSVSLLFQVAEGSADPDLPPQDVQWSVLCDNYWKPLGSSSVVADSTNQLLTSGIVKFVIPEDATTSNTILPTDMIWLKASVSRHVQAKCRLMAVVANAVEVCFTDNGNDPQHLLTALPSGSIAKLKDGIAAVKSVTQPYASFGGQLQEEADAFHGRVSERLRHKNRAVTIWDYERLVLDAFPKVHKVKCIPHASDKEWLAPGHVTLVVIPDLRNRNAVNPLQPKVDAGTISEIDAFLKKHIGMQVTPHVKNPKYQKLQLDFKVRFKTGYEFNFYRNALEQALIEYLSPWAYEDVRDLQFGGKVYKSVLLDFVEELDYVDYVTDFRLYSYSGDTNPYIDVNEVVAATPDSILVSDSTHLIGAIT